MAWEGLPVVNPGDSDWTGRLWLMWAGAYGDTKGYVWAKSEDDAFEEWVEWLDDNAPGCLTSFELDDYKRTADELGVTWLNTWPDWSDEAWNRVSEATEVDHTTIGHTTLKNGTHIASDQWGLDEVTDVDTLVLDAVRSEAWEYVETNVPKD